MPYLSNMKILIVNLNSSLFLLQDYILSYNRFSIIHQSIALREFNLNGISNNKIHRKRNKWHVSSYNYP